jgi:pimeloyl-ACP methyl ester carboxylesterase
MATEPRQVPPGPASNIQEAACLRVQPTDDRGDLLRLTPVVDMGVESVIPTSGPIEHGHILAAARRPEPARRTREAPDATVHKQGTASFALLADDVLALIEELGLDRPMICGFSEGAITATVLGIRNADSVRAIVNHAGYDFFNPHAPSFAIMRQMPGDSPEATEADPMRRRGR